MASGAAITKATATSLAVTPRSARKRGSCRKRQSSALTSDSGGSRSGVDQREPRDQLPSAEQDDRERQIACKSRAHRGPRVSRRCTALKRSV